MRKTKWLKRAVCVVLATATVLQLAGCSFENGFKKTVDIQPMEKEEVAKFSFDFIGGDNVMPIQGYYGPCIYPFSYNGNQLPDYFTDEFFQLIADSGINVIGHSYAEYTETKSYALKMLELGEKYGLGVQVYDKRLVGKEGAELSLETVDAYVNEYANYPSYIGNYLIDEPAQTQYMVNTLEGIYIEDCGSIFEKMNELGFYGYGNLLPLIEGKEDKYQAYIDEWLETCNPPYLLYDMYPFDDKDDGMKNIPRYFDNMTAIRASAEKANIPFWTFIQVGSQYNDAAARFDTNGYYPDKGQFMWNVNVSLAFGAKGIYYFSLLQPYYFAFAQSEPFDFQRNGLIGAWGNKTRWYYYAQDLNKQIAAADEVLMNSVNKGMIATGTYAKQHLKDNPYLLDGESWRELAGVSGDALIGCFNYQGKTALYVVNYDMEYAQKIQLKLQDTYSVTVIQDAEEKQMTTGNLELTMHAGGGALVVFE